MWNNAAALGQVAAIALWIAAGSGVIAAVAGFVGGVTANRASEITSEQAASAISAANARAEEAKRDTETLRSRIAWRRLSGEQKNALVQGLTGFNGDISIERVRSDPESQTYRDEIAEALAGGGIEVSLYMGSWSKVIGTHVNGPPGPARDQVVRAFREAGVPIDFVEDGETPEKPNIRVIVGTRADGLLER